MKVKKEHLQDLDARVRKLAEKAVKTPNTKPKVSPGFRSHEIK